MCNLQMYIVGSPKTGQYIIVQIFITHNYFNETGHLLKAMSKN